MSTFANLCLAAVITGCIVPATSLANPLLSQQETPKPTGESDKPANAPAKPHEPRPNPDASGKYHVGDGVTPPILVHSVEFAKKIQDPNHARCVVALTVDTDGKPTDVHIAPYSPNLKNEDNANLTIETRTLCLNAVEQYRFKPAIFQGKPVAVDLKVEISFKKFP